MKADTPSIHNYTIGDVSIDAGRKIPAKDFLIFRNDELKPNYEMMGRPLRSAHFFIMLVIEGEGHVQVNLIDYRVKKNSLLIIPFNVIHQFKKVNDDFVVVVVGFSHEFLGQARFNEKHINSFNFFSSQGDPYLMLASDEADALYSVLQILLKADRADYEHPFKVEIMIIV